MNRQLLKKFMALAFCLCFIAFSILSIAFISAHINHECARRGQDRGGGCQVCLEIDQARSLLKRFGAMLIGVLIAFFALSLNVSRVKSIILCINPHTPVALKVRSNN